MSVRPCENINNSRAQANNFQENFFPPTLEPLNEESQQHCEWLLSSKECFEASSHMTPEKSPATDSVPCEF